MRTALSNTVPSLTRNVVRNPMQNLVLSLSRDGLRTPAVVRQAHHGVGAS
jgi:hypothetical protein